MATLYQDLVNSFPWIRDIGLSMAWIQGVLAKAQSPAEIVAEIRKTPQYEQRFPGMYRADGSARFTEAGYVQYEQDVRRVLRQYGQNVDRDYRSPIAFVGFMEAEKDVNEIRDNLTVWRQVNSPGGDSFRDAFYVYTGKPIKPEDLYQAAVDPAAGQNLRENYVRAATMQFDYDKWIERATQVGLDRVARQLERLQRQGAVTAQVVQRMMSTNAQFARQVMEAIYSGGSAESVAQPLPLQDMLEAFEFAAIGAAATDAGLVMPTKERLVEIRRAGVERSQAIQSYRRFGRDAGMIAAAVARSRGKIFGQREFEQAEFFGSATATQDLEAGFAYMESVGREQGQFRFTERNGRIGQAGLRAY